MDYLLVDSLAALHLEQECVVEKTVLTIGGYEAYMVEQWACSRASNTVVCSYTGNAHNTVTVTVVHVPEKDQWGPITANFMDEISRNHLLTMDTPQGRMFIANMSSFPSNKTLIPIPNSFDHGLPFFIMNENLKRLGCTGRLPVSLNSCSDAVGANFYETFKVPTEVPLKFAVREIVTLLQLSLFYCGTLQGQRVDGFLCDYTLKAAQEWWQRFADTGPRIGQQNFLQLTIAPIIGFVLGCHNRLSLLGYKPPKDCFSVHYFLHCIHTFQKSERLEKTDSLNVSTVHRLRDLTARLKGQDLISTLKTSVKENLQGKIQAQLNDYETIDIADLAAVAKGQRSKYLWRATGHQFTPMSSFTNDRHDLKTGIPLHSLAEDATEPKLLKSPRQKRGNLLRKINKSVDHTSASTDQKAAQSTSTLLTLPNVSAVLTFSDDDTSENPQPELQPERPRLTDVALLTKDDTYKPLCRRQLRRTQSFSEVENVVCRWTFPPSIFIANRLYNEATALRDAFTQHIDTSQDTQQKFKQLLVSQEAEINNESRYSDTINYRIMQSTRKEQTVKQQIHSLEAITDKLDYQWAFLERQVAEVEKAVDKFHIKLEENQRRWRALQGRKVWWRG